jgi:hypothetical protein
VNKTELRKPARTVVNRLGQAIIFIWCWRRFLKSVLNRVESISVQLLSLNKLVINGIKLSGESALFCYQYFYYFKTHTCSIDVFLLR